MSVMPLGGSSGPLYSQSQSSSAVAAWPARAMAALWYAVQPIAWLALKAIAEHQTRRAVRELHNLDDRLLRDMGLTRAGIDHAVRNGRELDMVPFAAEWAMWGRKDAPHSFHRHD